MRIRICIICFLEFSADLERLLQGHAHRERDHLRELVALCDRHVENSRDVLYRLPCSECAESDYVGNPRLAVFLRNVIDRDLSALIIEVDVEVRHRYSFRV